MLRAGIVFGGVCLSAQNLENYWSEINVTWSKEYEPWRTLEVVGSWWHLTLTYDLESYFRIFSAQTIPLQWLELETSFLVWRYIFRISMSRFSFKVQDQVHGSKKAVACNSKTTGQKLVGYDRNVCYDNARSNSELQLYFKCEGTTLEYLGSIFKVMRLILGSRLQKSGSTQVCAPRGHDFETRTSLRYLMIYSCTKNEVARSMLSEITAWNEKYEWFLR